MAVPDWCMGTNGEKSPGDMVSASDTEDSEIRMCSLFIHLFEAEWQNISHIFTLADNNKRLIIRDCTDSCMCAKTENDS